MRKQPMSLRVQMVPDYLKDVIKIPTIQREPKVWTLEQKQNLIDSLYNDFDIPKIYLRHDNQSPDILWLIDGQQRLMTTKEFLNDEFVLAESSTLPKTIHNKKYGQLHPNDKSEITNRAFDCIVVTCSDDEEEDMFTRLNNGTPLNAAEKRNAMRGQVRDSVKNLSRHRFFRNKVNFTSRRYAHDAVAAQLTLLCLDSGPCDTKGKALRKLYKDKKRSYPERPTIEGKVRKILNLMDRIFSRKEPYMKKYFVATSFLFLYELTELYAVSRMTYRDWYKFFDDFEKSRIQNSQISEDDPAFDPDYSNFQLNCVNSPDSESGLKARHGIMLRKFFLGFRDIEPKDPRRGFTEHQKIAIYLLGNKKCAGVPGFRCPNHGRTLAFEECEFDHKRAHTDGGTTSVSNGQILCIECHRYKTDIDRSRLR